MSSVFTGALGERAGESIFDAALSHFAGCQRGVVVRNDRVSAPEALGVR